MTMTTMQLKAHERDFVEDRCICLCHFSFVGLSPEGQSLFAAGYYAHADNYFQAIWRLEDGTYTVHSGWAMVCPEKDRNCSAA